jgi:hypothetical protein
MGTCETLSVPGNKISCLNLNLVYAGRSTQLKEGWLMIEGESDTFIVCAGQRINQEG